MTDITDIQLLIVVVLIFGTGFTYWAWAISNTLMDIRRALGAKAVTDKPEMHTWAWQDEIAELRADNDRLKAELARIRGLPRLAALDAEIEGLREEVAILRTTEAAEVERLREQVDALLLVATSHEPEALRLQAENARLRAALDDCIHGRRDWMEKARRALEPKP